MGGSFAGAAQLREWRRYHVSGDVAGLEARRLLALYSRQNIPWDGLVSGPVLLEGDLRRKSTLAASARVAITPAESGPPVRGAVEAAYSARGETLDLARSWLQLPSTRVDFSGVLGRRLDVRLESRNLDDLPPALDVKSLPVRLENGTAGFQGTVTGKLDDPHIAGHVALARFAVNGTHFDAFQSDVAVSRTGVQLRGASAAHGTPARAVSGRCRAARLEARGRQCGVRRWYSAERRRSGPARHRRAQGYSGNRHAGCRRPPHRDV